MTPYELAKRYNPGMASPDAAETDGLRAAPASDLRSLIIETASELGMSPHTLATIRTATG